MENDNSERWGGLIFLIPAMGLMWFEAQHLLNLYCSDRLYSFGLHLNYGIVKFRDPWSDVVVLFCAFVAFASGAAIIFGAKPRRKLALAGVVSIGAVVLGFLAQ